MGYKLLLGHRELAKILCVSCSVELKYAQVFFRYSPCPSHRWQGYCLGHENQGIGKTLWIADGHVPSDGP